MNPRPPRVLERAWRWEAARWNSSSRALPRCTARSSAAFAPCRPDALSMALQQLLQRLGALVQPGPALEHLGVTAGIPVIRCHVAQAAMQVLAVVPVHEAGHPGRGPAQGGKAFRGVGGRTSPG